MDGNTASRSADKNNPSPTFTSLTSPLIRIGYRTYRTEFPLRNSERSSSECLQARRTNHLQAVFHKGKMIKQSDVINDYPFLFTMRLCPVSDCQQPWPSRGEERTYASG